MLVRCIQCNEILDTTSLHTGVNFTCGRCGAQMTVPPPNLPQGVPVSGPRAAEFAIVEDHSGNASAGKHSHRSSISKRARGKTKEGSVGVVVTILVGVIFLLGVVANRTPEANPDRPSSGNTDLGTSADAWYVGGTLHDKTIREWREATYANRLATSADFVAKIRGTVSRSEARRMELAISTAVRDGNVDYKSVSEIAAVIAVLQDAGFE